jgi:hypothetical protein
MSFLSPLALFLTILLPIIIAMYLLKLRRTEQVISSTYLWRRIIRDIEANAPWQRLRRNLLLLLQLLFLLVIIISLARPFTWTEGTIGDANILIFDTSASMAATDVNPNRLQVAKEQARLLISNLPPDSRCTIIDAGSKPSVLISSSQDKHRLYRAIDNINIQSGDSDMTSALELASAIAARIPDTEIVIYSDGNVDLPTRLAINGLVRYQPIGINGDNQAISLVNLRPDEEGVTAFIQVINQSMSPVQSRLKILADGQLVDAHDLDIPAKGQVSIISEGLPIDTEVFETKFADPDMLILDDTAWAVQRTPDIQNVSLISHGNRFLETALGLLSNLEIQTIRPEDYSIEPQNNVPNLTIFDSYIPTDTLPTGNLLFIGPISNTSYFSITGTLENPKPLPASDTDPILKYVDLNEVSILDAASLELPDWARPVLIDDISGNPLLFVGQIDGRRIAVFAFDLRNSDLPLQVAYPILVANLMDWLLPGNIGDIPTQVSPGEAVTFTPQLGVTKLIVTSPDGLDTVLEIQNGQAIYADTNQVGVYQVTWGEDQSLSFAVNLSNIQESDILPKEQLSLIDNDTETQSGSTRKARLEWWHPLAVFALILLIIEWLVYNRATLSKIRHLISKTKKSRSDLQTDQ